MLHVLVGSTTTCHRSVLCCRFFFVARSAAPPLSALSERFKIRVCHKENRGDLTLQQDLWQPWWTCVCLKRRNARRNGSIQWVLTN